MSAMDAIRPTQFSALKVLNPPDDEEEHGENDDRYADDQKVVHGDSQDLNQARDASRDGLIKALASRENCGPCRSHTRSRGFLTEPMHAGG